MMLAAQFQARTPLSCCSHVGSWRYARARTSLRAMPAIARRHAAFCAGDALRCRVTRVTRRVAECVAREVRAHDASYAAINMPIIYARMLFSIYATPRQRVSARCRCAACAPCGAFMRCRTRRCAIDVFARADFLSPECRLLMRDDATRLMDACLPLRRHVIISPRHARRQSRAAIGFMSRRLRDIFSVWRRDAAGADASRAALMRVAMCLGD